MKTKNHAIKFMCLWVDLEVIMEVNRDNLLIANQLYPHYGNVKFLIKNINYAVLRGIL